MPKFSIIIPVYNVAPYLRECLDSVLAQTFTDWEAICVDDGSMDGSGAILDEYAAKDSRFRVIHQANAGVSVARNAGIRLAQGDWVSFVDSDDWVAKDYLASFDSLKMKADVNFINVVAFRPNGVKYCFKKTTTQVLVMSDRVSRVLYERAFSKGQDTFGWTHNKFVRRSVLTDVWFKPGLNMFEDELFGLELCNVIQTFQMTDLATYHYRLGGGGLTGRKHNREQIAIAFAKFVPLAKYRFLKALALRRVVTLRNGRLGQFIKAGLLEDPWLSFLWRLQLIKEWLWGVSIISSGRKLYRWLRRSGEFTR